MMDYLNYISSHPDRCGGKPCVEGTRMRVKDILGYLAAGDTIDDLVELYPYISREGIMACLAYAADHADTPIFRAAAE